jgi:thiol-disulfide isomerase/thioredoxin
MKLAKLFIKTMIPFLFITSLFAATPKILAVKFHADWCGSCKKISPLFKNLENKFDGKKVLFVNLDFTNQTKKNRSLLLASGLNIGHIVEKNKGTGFVLLIDSKDKKILQKLTKKDSLKKMSASILKHI